MSETRRFAWVDEWLGDVFDCGFAGSDRFRHVFLLGGKIHEMWSCMADG